MLIIKILKNRSAILNQNSKIKTLATQTVVSICLNFSSIIYYMIINLTVNDTIGYPPFSRETVN